MWIEHEIVCDRISIVGGKAAEEPRHVAGDRRGTVPERLVVLHQIVHGVGRPVDRAGRAIQLGSAGEGKGIGRRLHLRVQRVEPAAVYDEGGKSHEHGQREGHIDQRRTALVAGEAPAETRYVLPSC